MFTIQEQAEWAGNDSGIDQDWEAETEEEARKIAADIVRGGSIAVIYDEAGREIDYLEPRS